MARTASSRPGLRPLTRVLARLGVLTGLVGFALALLASPALGTGPAQATPGIPTPEATATPEGTPQPLINLTVIDIRFPHEVLYDALMAVGANVTAGIVRQFVDVVRTLDAVLGWMIPGTDALGDDYLSVPLLAAARPFWEALRTLSLVLLPLTLAVSVLGTLQLNVASVTRWVEAKEAFFNWLYGAAFAVASVYFIGLASHIAFFLAGSIAEVPIDGYGGGLLAEIVGQLTPGSLATGQGLDWYTGLPPIGQMVAALFWLTVVGAMVLIALIGLAGFVAAYFMLTAVAPLVLVASTMPMFDWLRREWLKSLTLVLLLPVVNALLLRGGVTLGRRLVEQSASGDWPRFVFGLILMAGMASAMCAVNFQVTKALFGAGAQAVADVGRAAVAVTALAAAAFTGGLSALGAAGAVSGAAVGSAAAAGSSTAATGSAAVGSGTAATLMGSAEDLAARPESLAAPRAALQAALDREGRRQPAQAQLQRGQAVASLGRLAAMQGGGWRPLGSAVEFAGQTIAGDARQELAALDHEERVASAHDHFGREAHQLSREALADQRYAERQAEAGSDRATRLARGAADEARTAALEAVRETRWAGPTAAERGPNGQGQPA